MKSKNRYLYGAVVQGIQSFIFQTNELKDIVGASELVERICTTAFASVLGKEYEKGLQADSHAILMAAGNIKYVFEEVEQCREVVRQFPRKILEIAPGITLSQAVVKMTGDFSSDVSELNRRLKAQRNKLMPNITLGLMGIRRSRKTGFPAIENKLNVDGKGEEYLDAATKSKREFKEVTRALCEKSFNRRDLTKYNIVLDIDDLVGKNDWIAVIHADGNGLGQVVREIGKDPEALKLFSGNLNQCTIEAANGAYQQFGFAPEERIPIRPVVLGGDDMTVICRADLAIKYVETFMRLFEERSTPKMTACAGIAFIKSSYPFHYGYHLAEQLCGRAKKDARRNSVNELAPSCLMFYKVQDSFMESFELIAKRELTPLPKYSFEFGPYYLNEAPAGRWTIDKLKSHLTDLQNEEGRAVRSNLRQWLTCMHAGKEVADQKRQRMLSLFNSKNSKVIESATEQQTREYYSEGKMKEKQHSAAFDLLSLYSVVNQDTKTNINQ